LPGHGFRRDYALQIAGFQVSESATCRIETFENFSMPGEILCARTPMPVGRGVLRSELALNGLVL
jgi:hypothetical protein